MVIHGREHTVGVSVDKLEKLCHDTCTMLRAGLASGRRVAESAPWESPESINKLEVRAMSTALRWALSSSLSIRRRLLLLSDSQAAVGAITKGRTSSHPLLCRLRPVNALLLASGVQLFVRWIRSEDNPADAPSRRFSNHAAQA